MARATHDDPLSFPRFEDMIASANRQRVTIVGLTATGEEIVMDSVSVTIQVGSQTTTIEAKRTFGNHTGAIRYGVTHKATEPKSRKRKIQVEE